MALSCMTVSAFAADTSVAPAADASDASVEASESNAVSEASARNVDLYLWPSNTLLDGFNTVVVTPGKGANMKIHLEIIMGSVKVQVRKSGSLTWKTVADWETSGHHWADLVTNCDSGNYQVRLFCTTALFSGGVYTE